MRVEVLGPLRVLAGDDALDLTGSRVRTALSWLVMNANTRVSFATLSEIVWTEPPADATHRLRMLLRSVAIQLPPQTLLVAESAHLVLADGTVDAERFADLIREGYRHWTNGDRDRARANVDAALSLWRGAPYPELAECPAAAPDIERLWRLRLDALELQQETVTARAVDFATVADLRWLAGSYPDRRGFRLQLARALATVGRQVEALQVLRQAATDLGDDPTARQLTSLIATRDPAAATAPTIDPGASGTTQRYE
jgi:DNA-binding SARP family transcriptional activator